MLIGYVPINPSLDPPGDRRRFPYYAIKRNIPFEVARPSRFYDVAVLSQAADLSMWSRCPKGSTKIIFDLIDSYLSIPPLNARSLLRGAAKFIARQNNRLRLNYRRAIQDMCRRADAVVCATEEQRQSILPFCSNVHIILDFHGEIAGVSKRDYSSSENVFHLVWEGLGSNARHLREVEPALRMFSRRRRFQLHVVTDMEYGRFLGGRFGKRSVLDDLRGISPDITVYGWNILTFPAIVTKCDLALIPLPLRDPLCAGKPENRLLLFWRLGMPVLATSTPTHTRAMKACGLNTALTTQEEWQQALEYYSSSEPVRRQAAQLGRSFAETHHSEERLLQRWDEVFRSI